MSKKEIQNIKGKCESQRRKKETNKQKFGDKKISYIPTCKMFRSSTQQYNCFSFFLNEIKLETSK